MGLAGLLVEARSATTPVALASDRTKTWSDLVRDVERLAGALEPGAWLLHTEDAYAFCVALLAVGQVGATAIAPPNAQSGTLQRLAGECRGALGDASLRAPLGLPVLDPLRPPKRPAAALRELEPEAVLLALFTSGTTGEAKRAHKTVAQLDSELEVLQKQFGREADDAAVLATVSPQHLYGLLFRVLWPLVVGRPFVSRACATPGELVAQAAGRPSFVLVSTPAFLARTPAATLASMRHCRAVFSSGSPLHLDVAQRVWTHAGLAPIEVLGSTETGGVAQRRQVGAEASTAWTPLPSVGVRVDAESGQLRVQSPFLSTAEGEFVMGDRATLDDRGRFELLGRADRTVKVGDKRVSLEALEQALEAHGSVRRAAAVQLESGRIGAVVVLSAAGAAELRRVGRARVSRALRDHLGNTWDPVLRPRAWRYVDRFPEDAQGKVSRSALLGLFASSRPTRPVVLSTRRSDAGVRWRCRVPVDLLYLEGHFPGRPLVPGVAQLDWVLRLAAGDLGPLKVVGVDALKFVAPLEPGQEFEIAVRSDADASVLRFRVSREDQLLSSGRITLG